MNVLKSVPNGFARFRLQTNMRTVAIMRTANTAKMTGKTFCRNAGAVPSLTGDAVGVGTGGSIHTP